MADRPLIFSGPMIRALLDGRKSMTRRVLKPQPEVRALASEHLEDHELRGWHCIPAGDDFAVVMRLPYAVGDRLWVREGWRAASWNEDSEVWIEYLADKQRSVALHPGSDFVERLCDEMEARGAVIGEDGLYDGNVMPRGKSSIHMPRWASRLTLLVTGVKVERLQEISEEDAKAEGVADYADFLRGLGHPKPGDDEPPEALASRLRWPQRSFANLWNSINGPGAWEANPWVAAITFTVHKANIDHLPAEAA